MNNEEKILSLLEQMNGRLDMLEQGQKEIRSDVNVLKTDMNAMQSDVSVLKTDMAAVKEDIEVMKEDSAVTRNGVNTLLDWAEQAEVEVKIPLYKKAN